MAAAYSPPESTVEFAGNRHWQECGGKARQGLRPPPRSRSRRVAHRSSVPHYFNSWANPRFTGWVGIDLNDSPASNRCWSSTLFSHVAKLTVIDAMAE
jgi:hypothetical protein